MSLQDEPDPVLKECAATDSLTASRNASDIPWQYRDPSVPKNEVGSILMTRPKILLVDNDDNDIFLTRRSLERKSCEVVTAMSVPEALRQIATQTFDVLITDLHMPEAGDGFTVVTAMRRSQPEALTLVVSGFPDVQKAMAAILLQADEVLMKPFDVEQLADLIAKRTLISKSSPTPAKESVANILDRDIAITVKRWLSRLEQVPELTSLTLAAKQRTEYLPEMMKNITTRLRADRAIEAIENPSPAAVAHGQLRYRQGYTAPLIVQESRMLQVCIFETIERNLLTVDFASVLPDIMIIADEVDSQLKQSIDSFLTMQREGAGLASSA
jgi:ActR/RegA family two-component response regulator